MYQHQKLYIPVTPGTISTIKNAKTQTRLKLDSLAIEEIAGLLALQNSNIASEDFSHHAFETILEKVFWAAKDTCLHGDPEDFKAEALNLLNLEILKESAEVISQKKVGLVSPETIKKRSFLTPKGDWDNTFKARFRAEENKDYRYPSNLVRNVKFSGEFTAEQTRLLGAIENNPFDPYAIQGLAGSGKTFVIQLILDMIKARGIRPENVLMLSYTNDQLKALMDKLPHDYNGLTFSYLAGQMLPPEFWRKATKDKHLKYGEVVNYYNIKDIAGLTANLIVYYIQMTVQNFCYTTDEQIEESHLPYAVQSRKIGGWKENNVLRAYIVKTAQDFWGKTFKKSFQEIHIPIRGFHRIKIASQMCFKIPANYGFILIDESHDLTPPMVRILENNPQCNFISLGDCFQNINAFDNKHSALFNREMNQSFRAGNALGELINPIVKAHPSLSETIVYSGHSGIDTSIKYYKKPTVPDSPTAILTSDMWSLWEWTQRVANAGLHFELISDPDNLTHFVGDVIKLKEFGTKPTYWSIAKYTTWNSMVEDMQKENNIGFQRIFEMLDRSYSILDWRKALVFYAVGGKTPSGKPPYVLGMAESSRNREYKNVMLTPDMASLVRDTKSGKKMGINLKSQRISKLYVGATRGQVNYLVPIELRHWVEEITGRKAQP